MKLKDKVVLVTGGGRGIGRAVAIACGREGARLALCARTEGELEKAVADIRAVSPDSAGWTCDVSSEEAVAKLIANVRQKFGHVDVLINNAGVMTRSRAAWEHEIAKWDHTIAVNLLGVFLVTRAVPRLMIAQRSGPSIKLSETRAMLSSVQSAPKNATIRWSG